MKVIAPLHYRDEVPYLLRNLKFHNRLDVAEALADLMEMAVRLHPLEPFDAIVAVPLHPKRMHERGYNQADELCKHLAKKLSIAHLSMAMQAVEAAGVKSVTGLVVASGRKREVSLATET